MGVEVSQIDDRHIFVSRFFEPFNVEVDVPRSFELWVEHYSSAIPVVYNIVDMREVEITFSQIVLAMAGATKSNETGLNARAENLRSIILGTDEMLALASESLQQEQYGALQVPMYATMEEALAHINAVAR